MSNLINSYSLSSVIGIGTDAPNQNLTVVGGISSSNVVYDASGNSTQWNSTYTNVKANSASYATTNYVASNYLNLTGGTVGGSILITGSISAQGTAYFANTLFTTTSALCAVVNSAGPGLYITQKGSGDIASFYDGNTKGEVVHIGGSLGIPGVGVYTSNPNVELTVNGRISASQVIYASGGNSNNWNNAYTLATGLSSISSSWVTYSNLNTGSFVKYTDINSVSSNWNNAYTLATGLTSLSSNWQNAYTLATGLTGLSSNWQSTYTTLCSTSANWNTAYTLATGLTSLSSNWQNTYTTLCATSANWNSAYTLATGLTSLSSNWQSSYTTLCSTSGSWNATNTVVSNNSANWAVEGLMPVSITTNSTVGGLTQGTVFTANTPLSTILQRMIVAAISATYTYPTLSASTSAFAFEVGSSITPIISSVWTQNDAGSATSYTILSSYTYGTSYAPITSFTSFTTTYNISSLSSVTLSPFFLLSTTYIEASATYAQGPQKQDNYGNNSGTPIPAYFVVSSAFGLSAYRNIFYTSDTSTVVLSSSPNIRALSNTPAQQITGQSITFPTTINDTRVAFAYPYQYAITQVTTPTDGTLTNATNSVASIITNVFSVSTVSVSGANSLSPILYRVFKRKTNAPATGNYTITSTYNAASSNPAYTTPSHNFSPTSNSSTDEAGKTITGATYTYTYAQNYGGTVTAVAFLSSTSSSTGYVLLSTTNTSNTSFSYTTPSLIYPSTATSTTYYFRASSAYTGGAQYYSNYNDAYGTPLAAGSYVPAGSDASYTLTSQFKVYVGVTTSSNPTDVQIRTGSTGWQQVSAISASRPTGTYTFNFGSSPQYYIFVAYPSSMGTSTFVQGGLGATYNLTTVPSFTNQYGVATSYYVYVSPASYINSSQTLVIS